MDGSKMSVPKKEDETTIFYWKLEKEKAAGESDKEIKNGRRKNIIYVRNRKIIWQ